MVTVFINNFKLILAQKLAGYSSLFAYENLRKNVLWFCIHVIHHAVRKEVQFYTQSYSIYSNRLSHSVFIDIYELPNAFTFR